MNYGSACSGIESASVAWEPLGFKPAWFAEIEPFPSAVLAHHWPTVANLGDMRALPALIRAGAVSAPDILVGGTPCQAFSVAGMRKGLVDPRGQLTIKYVEVANEIDKQRPKGEECIAVWENVPGVLSSKDNAFGCFLAAFVGEDDPLEPSGKKWSNAGIVYGPQRVAAWRILDAQYFGVAQRRRRVFVVASARDGFDPAKVLFESEGVRRDTPPSRETGEGLAPTVTAGPPFSRTGNQRVECEALVYPDEGFTYDVAPSLRGDGPGNGGRENVVAVRTANTSANGIGVDEELAYTLDGAQGQAVCFAENSRAEVRLEGGDGRRTGALSTGGGKPGQGVPVVVAFQQNASGEVRTGEQAYTLNTNSNASGRNTGMISTGVLVRRLTPRECERLQGFPDDHTLIDWRSRASRRKIEQDVYKYFLRTGCSHEEAEAAARHPDGPRYKAIGNSKAVPVIRWLGERIKKEIEK